MRVIRIMANYCKGASLTYSAHLKADVLQQA